MKDPLWGSGSLTIKQPMLWALVKPATPLDARKRVVSHKALTKLTPG